MYVSDAYRSASKNGSERVNYTRSSSIKIKISYIVSVLIFFQSKKKEILNERFLRWRFSIVCLLVRARHLNRKIFEMRFLKISTSRRTVKLLVMNIYLSYAKNMYLSA